MKPAIQTLARIDYEAATPRTGLRFVGTCNPGEHVRQGDVCLVRAQHPEHLMPQFVPSATKQLAPGNAPGSRHVCHGKAAVFEPKATASALHDPLDRRVDLIVQALSRVEIRHPEHATLSIPAGWYLVLHQQDFEPRPSPLESVQPEVIRPTAPRRVVRPQRAYD
jgi:hypothetical protein